MSYRRPRRLLDRRTVRKALTEEFERILRLMIAEKGSRPSAATPFPEASPSRPPAFFFPQGATLGAFGEPGEQEYQFEGESAIYLRLFPKFSDAQPRLSRVALRTLVHDRRVLHAMANSPMAALSAPNDHGYVVFEPISASTTKGITQAFLTGELWGINSQVFQTARVKIRFKGPDESATAMGVITAERIYTRTLENYVSVAVSEMNLRLPFVLEIGAVGLKGVYMGAPHPEVSQGHYYGPIREPSLVRRYELPDASSETLYGVLRQFFNELYDLAECSRLNVLTDEHIRRNVLPERR